MRPIVSTDYVERSRGKIGAETETLSATTTDGPRLFCPGSACDQWRLSTTHPAPRRAATVCRGWVNTRQALGLAQPTRIHARANIALANTQSVSSETSSAANLLAGPQAVTAAENKRVGRGAKCFVPRFPRRISGRADPLALAQANQPRIYLVLIRPSSGACDGEQAFGLQIFHIAISWMLY